MLFRGQGTIARTEVAPAPIVLTVEDESVTFTPVIIYPFCGGNMIAGYIGDNPAQGEWMSVCIIPGREQCRTCVSFATSSFSRSSSACSG